MDLDFTVYIRPDAFILVPVLFFLGMFLRQTPPIPAWIHVWVQLFFGVIACLLYYGFKIEAVVQGILVTGTAVIFRDLIENTMDGMLFLKKKKKEEDD